MKGPGGLVVSVVVLRVDVRKAKGTDARHLRDVLTRLGAMEMWGAVGENDDAARWICPQLFTVELAPKAA